MLSRIIIVNYRLLWRVEIRNTLESCKLNNWLLNIPDKDNQPITETSGILEMPIFQN